jgi:hypothetical protein
VTVEVDEDLLALCDVALGQYESLDGLPIFVAGGKGKQREDCEDTGQARNPSFSSRHDNPPLPEETVSVCWIPAIRAMRWIKNRADRPG